MNLMAAFICLAAIGNAAADGVVTVIGATGGGAIPASTAGGAWTTLSGPSITNIQANAIAGSGTMVLTAPAGFQFNPGAAVKALVTGAGDIINTTSGATIPATVTPSTVTINITSKTTGSGSGSANLTFQNIQVRPTAGSPLASGYITRSGTCSFQNINNLTGNWGFLREVGGSLAGYIITGTNYGTAGQPISITIQKIDQFGNPLSDSTSETLIFSGFGTIGTYAPTVNGSTDAFTTGISVGFDSNGTATVTLTDYLAGSGTLNLTDGTHTSTGGLPILVAAGTASTLTIADAPVSVAYGSSFSLNVSSTDQYGNPSTTGLNSSVPVTVSLASGSGTLTGNLNQDLGSAAGDGTATFTGLQITAAGSGDVLSVDAPGFTSGTTTITVTPLVVTPAVVVGHKTYDGTTIATIIGRSLSGVLPRDDVSLGLTGAGNFTDKHAGTGKLVMVTDLALTGSAAGNYQLATTWAYAAANITPKPLVVAASSQRKLYDGTISSTAAPNFAACSLATGDSCSLSQHFNDKLVGKGNTLIPSGSINDGNGGLNYSVTLVSTNGRIDPRPITVTAVADSKLYDGTAVSTAAPVITGELASGDLPNFTQAFDNKNPGTGKTLTPSGSINDGNGGNNYIVSFVSVAGGTITARTLTVTAVADSKMYDGTTTSAASPSVTGTLLAGDIANFVQSFDNKNVGTGKTLVASGSVNDGNGGNNYIVSFVSTAAGSIIPRPLSVSAISDNKTYDGTTSSAAVPVITSGSLLAGDTANFSQSFDSRNVGAVKVLTPMGAVTDGNGGANYTVSFSNANGSIAPRSLAVAATGVNKVFDGTTAATVILSDNRIAGDALAVSYLAASFSDASVGMGKLVQVSGITVTGTDAANYLANTSTTTTAAITAAVSTTLLSSSQNPIVEGASVSFTARISAAATVSSQPSGLVQFYVNGQLLGNPVSVNGGAASLTTSQLKAGSNTVSAAYLGDSSFQASTTSMVQAVQMDISILTILSIVANPDGTSTVTFQGVPNTSYLVQATPDFSLPVQWANFSTNVSGYIDGKWTVVDDMTQHVHRFFRGSKF